MNIKKISQQRLKEVLRYDPETGIFTWVKSGRRAGNYDGRYRRIRVDWVLFYEHRLAWAYMTGEWPDYIDHENWDKQDNRLCNLRVADKSKNGSNRGKAAHNTSGFKGVSYDKDRNKFVAQIAHEKQHYFIGRYVTAEEAHAAYAAKAIELFGEFAHAG